MTHLYERLADLLEYPGGDWGVQFETCKRQVSAESPDLASDFLEFCRKVGNLSVAELQEFYTRTFDLNPVCALEIGYHVFGENYKRGVLLAKLRETESPYGLGQDHQLPDYLPVLLRLLVRLEDVELRSALISEFMIPAVEKMVEALSRTQNPYADLMKVLSRALDLDVRQTSVATASQTMCFPIIHQVTKAGGHGDPPVQMTSCRGASPWAPALAVCAPFAGRE
jgi:nitrate reductase delta subunit